MKIASQTVALLRTSGSDLDVVDAARVSFDKTSEWERYGMFDEVPADCQYDATSRTHFRLSDKDQKLINYLAKHNHWSPLAHVGATFRIKAPIFVARQLVKHQVGLVWNEVSRRYVSDEPEFYFPEVWRGKPVNAKQGSEGVVDLHSEMSNYDDYYSPESVCEFCYTAYDKMITAGVAPEQARMILPQNTMTQWIWTGSLMAFARVCKQRLDPHAQQETQEIAQLINKEMESAFPVSWKAVMQ
jgi:thymidylate synthase (FAD)